MKKIKYLWFLYVMMVNVIAFVLSACSSGESGVTGGGRTATGPEKIIIGTWVNNENGNLWVFEADGTLKRGDAIFSFCLADTKLATMSSRNALVIYDTSFSSDGKHLILEGSVSYSATRGGSGMGNRDQIIYNSPKFWLTRQEQGQTGQTRQGSEEGEEDQVE